MMKFLCFVYFLAIGTIVFSQQDRQFTHYMYDRMSYNPSTTGFKGYCGTIIYRNQWDRVDRAPNTTVFNVQGNLQNLMTGPGKIGVGLSVANDVIGFQRNNNVVGNIAYHLQTCYGVLSGGVGVGMINIGFDPGWIPPQTTAEEDPLIAPISQKISRTNFDANAGLFWSGNKEYYVGVSTTHLAPTQFAGINYKLARHYYVLAGFKHEVGQRYFNLRSPVHLRPGVLVKADGATMIFDTNVRFDAWIDNTSYIWGGFTYRLSDAVALMLGYSKNGFKAGYSYDIMTNALNEYGKGTHELMLSYCIFPAPKSVFGPGNPFILQ